MAKKQEKLQRYTVWNDWDPNDSFTVDAPNAEAAALAALEELGWVLGTAAPVEEDEE